MLDGNEWEKAKRNASQYISARRCGTCDLNWPFDEKDEDGQPLNLWCARCKVHTSVVTLMPYLVMTRSEAATARFEAYAAQRDDKAFEEIIEGAGFTPEERADIAKLEGRMDRLK